MTSNTPPSPDGSSIPPRHRPDLVNLAKDNSEKDLWAFDDAEESEELEGASESQPQIPTQKSVESFIPQPRKEKPAKPSNPLEGESPLPEKAQEGRGRMKLDVGRIRKQGGIEAVPTSYLSPGGDFGDLDKWEEAEPAVAAELPAPPVSAPGVLEEGLVATSVSEPVSEPVIEVEDESRDEFSPSPRSKSSERVPLPLPRLGLSKVERLGMVFLLALLVVGGGILFFNSINRLPSEALLGQFKDFPVEGTLVTLERAETFWREPSAGDTVRRGTQLLPVISLTISGGPAALRVFFRDADGTVVGDAVSRSVGEAETVEIAATAGFEEAWMHDTYSTIGGDPWTIEILEGPSQGSPVAEFNKLLKMNVATERR